ncbi:MAG: hypothetical protein KKA67_14740 [Spirochaetes bacterium]|nr:hypothetical protein [Spirochaetota bacterium]MBU1081519.1 hypothetical protein [Spirochaetota bacterium]
MRGNALRLAAADVRLVARDPLLLIMPFVPFLAAFALRLILPPLSAFIEGATGFNLLGYATLVRVVLILFPGTFYGMVAGFLLLDDRDDGVSAYWSATPVGRAGYIAVRLALFSLAAFAAGLAIGPILGIGSAGPWRDAGAAFLGAGQTAFFALFLAAVAADKVEGLAILKAMSGLDIVPLAILLPLPARALAWAFPQYWAAELLAGDAPFAGGGSSPYLALALGAVASVAWIAVLAAKYRKRID